ncbi:MAG: hypothetical protein L0H63_13230 [Nitrococcus sp.]|nr:hypothetical protein [Nitrococcus sp.]
MEKIRLAEMIKQLRRELLDAQAADKDEPLRFGLQDIEIELTVATTKEAGGGGGVKFWVYNADASGKVVSGKTQTLRLTLRPLNTDGTPFDIYDEDEAPRRD